MIIPDAYFRDVWEEERKKQRTAEKKWTEPVLSRYSSVEYSVERLPSGCLLFRLHARCTETEPGFSATRHLYRRIERTT
jgi:hypothetical protein